MEFIAQIRMSMMQVLAHAHQGLIQSQSGFDANNGEVKSVGQPEPNAILPVFGHALQHKARNKKTETGDASEEEHIVDAGEEHDASEAKHCQKQARADVIVDMDRITKASLDQPGTGAGNVGGGEWNRSADGVEGLLEPFSERRLVLRGLLLSAHGAQARAQNRAGSDGSRAKGKHRQHDCYENDNDQDYQHR